MHEAILLGGAGLLAMAMPIAAQAAPTAPQTKAAQAPQDDAAVRAAVTATLDASAAGWNAVDIDRFMECYENAPATSYISGPRLAQGYQAIRALYIDRFAGGAAAAMGHLTLEIVDLRRIGADHAYVIGRFHLSRDAAHGGDATGLTTLLFHRSAAGWRIIADHS